MPNRPPTSRDVSTDAKESTRAAGTRITSVARHLLGLVLVTQPLPGAVATLSVGVFAFVASAASHNTIDISKLVRLLVGIECTQLAIGSVNDFCDRQKDMLSGRIKPVALGWIRPWEALVVATVATIGLLIAVTPLGIVTLTLVMVIEILGLAYDFWLKGTVISGLLYAVAFPLSPILAWSVFGHWQPFLIWLFPLGGLLGISMNISNALPDLDVDIANGIRGLPQLIGPKIGLAFSYLAPIAVLSGIWLLDLLQLVPGQSSWLLFATVSCLVFLVLSSILYLYHPSKETLRANFIIQALGIICLGTGWIAAAAF